MATESFLCIWNDPWFNMYPLLDFKCRTGRKYWARYEFLAAQPLFTAHIQKSLNLFSSHRGGTAVLNEKHNFFITKWPLGVNPSQVPRLTWKSVGRTNPPGAGNFTLEPHNSKFSMVVIKSLVLIGKLHTWTGYWHWCHSLSFTGCPARSSFRSPRVCNLVRAVIVL